MYPIEDAALPSDEVGYYFSNTNLYSTQHAGTDWSSGHYGVTLNQRILEADRIHSSSEKKVYLMYTTTSDAYATDDGGANYTKMTGLEKDTILYDWVFVDDTGYIVGANGLLLRYQRE